MEKRIFKEKFPSKLKEISVPIYFYLLRLKTSNFMLKLENEIK